MPPRSNLNIPQGGNVPSVEEARALGARGAAGPLCRRVLDSPPTLPAPQPSEAQGSQTRGRRRSDRRRSGAAGTRRPVPGAGRSAPEPGSAGTKARRSGDPRRLGPGLTPRRHTLSSRIAIMCSGPGRAGAQQHRPGRTAPSLRPAVSQRSRPPRGGTVAAAISGPRPPRSVTCRRPAPPDASSLA